VTRVGSQRHSKKKSSIRDNSDMVNNSDKVTNTAKAPEILALRIFPSLFIVNVC
jgi:hypothetical protein